MGRRVLTSVLGKPENLKAVYPCKLDHLKAVQAMSTDNGEHAMMRGSKRQRRKLRKRLRRGGLRLDSTRLSRRKWRLKKEANLWG